MIAGTTLILILYGFVYVPEPLSQGTWLEISAATVSYAFGYAALAAATQGTDFFPLKVTHARRGLFSAAAVCFLFPMIVWLKIAGAVLLALAWGAVPLTCARKQADGHYGKRRPPSRPLPGPYRIMTERPRARYARDRRARPVGQEIQDIKVIGPERSVLTFIGG